MRHGTFRIDPRRLAERPDRRPMIESMIKAKPLIEELLGLRR